MSYFERVLPEIINSLKSAFGDEFFNVLTQQLHKHIGADYTFIARFNQKEYTSETICLVAKGEVVDNFEYSLENTPCAEVNSNNEICVYQQSICQLFPLDQLLIDMKIEGYIGTPLHDSHGNVIGLVVALHERKIENSEFIVTLFELFSGRISAEFEREDRERELKNLASTLEIKIDERTNNLSNTVKHLKETQSRLIQSEKMAALGNLTASIAHEINNPTNFTHAAVYIMLDEVIKIKEFLKQLAGGENADSEILASFDNEFDKLTELVKTANEGTKRIKSIVESLRTFSHLGHFTKENAFISSLIKSTINLIRTEYRDIKITTNFEYDPLFNCFPSKLNQVFMNLIVNACQAVLSKAKQASENETEYVGVVAIKTYEEDNQMIIAITDNGSGMDKAIQERIFEPFYTTKDVNNGMGLGMSVSFEVIESHNGAILVSSEINKGSEITIKLPVE